MAKVTKKPTDQSLESIMWNCRNTLRGTVGGNEKNRDAVLGLVFLKFAGDKFDKRRDEIHTEYGDVPTFLEKKSFYLSKNVFFLNELPDGHTLSKTPVLTTSLSSLIRL